jgi:asparagine synthase (glutamine-hydrolysing)
VIRAVPGLSGYTPLIDFEHPADTMIRWGGFARTEIERLCEEPVSFADTTFYRTFERHRRATHFDRYTALYNAMPFERLTQATRVSGLPVRYPFYERDTDGFLRQLPADFRHLPEQPKRILRALLARYVPRELWDLPKHGFDFPLAAFLEGEDFALVRTHLDEGRWRGGGLLRGDLVARYARDFIAGDRRLVFRVWALVVLGAWLQAHGMQR